MKTGAPISTLLPQDVCLFLISVAPTRGAVPLPSHKSAAIVKRGESRACCSDEVLLLSAAWLCCCIASGLQSIILAQDVLAHEPCGWSKIRWSPGPPRKMKMYKIYHEVMCVVWWTAWLKCESTEFLKMCSIGTHLAADGFGHAVTHFLTSTGL